MDNTTEILKGKAEAVRALADAMKADENINASAVRFAENWAQAVESMVPQPSEREAAIAQADAEDEASLKALKARCSDVSVWRDRTGDLWVRNSGGGWRVSDDMDTADVSLMNLADVEQRWGPLTAV
jgi:vacuolar-type H+-ATPase subunit E/Vma4